jgi:hypothetical protein
MTMTTITTYSQLIDYIRANNLNVKQSQELIRVSLMVISLVDYLTTEDFLKVVEDYWNKYKHCIGEHPIFLEDFEIGMVYNEDTKFYSLMENKE